MTNFAASSLKFLRKLLDRLSTPTSRGEPTVLDGLSAVAHTESRMSQSAGLGATFPAAIGARWWRTHVHEGCSNQFGEPTGAIDATSPRGALSAAIGLAISGERATAFLSGPDLMSGQDLLAIAAGHHLPLILHLACRAGPGGGQAIGGGHDAYHLAGAAGLFQLFAMNVQEAVDFAMIARRVAELSLIPGVVAMDSEETALAAQDVIPAAEALIEQFVGRANRVIDSPTEAQRLFFGDTRRLVPRFYDLDQPSMLSPLHGPDSYAIGAAGAQPYFHDHLQGFLVSTFDAFAELTGRRYDALMAHRIDDADIVLVAQGSAVETAMAFADHARARQRTKVGVLGVRTLQPVPLADIQKYLIGRPIVAALERTNTPGGGTLLNRMQLAFHGAKQKDSPRFVSVRYGLGGLPFRAADLTLLMKRLAESEESTLYLGAEFARNGSSHPKHQAMMDAVRRAYPTVERLGVRSDAPAPDVRPEGALTIALCRPVGQTDESLAGDVVAIIHQLLGGRIRSRPAVSWRRFGDSCVDVITHASEQLHDPGDDAPVDVAVLIDAGANTLGAERLHDHSVVLLAPGKVNAAVAKYAGDDRELYAASCDAGDEPPANWRHESILGALTRLVLNRLDAAVTLEKAAGARETRLASVSEEDRIGRLDAFAAGWRSLTQVEFPVSDSAPAGEQGPRRATRELARFWDRVGVAYDAESREAITALPQASVPSVPPGSSALYEVGGACAMLPVFDPTTCQGDPRLWTTCPDGSLAPLVISARALIDAGVDLATKRGAAADALRSIASQLAKRANRIVASSESPPATAGELLLGAFDDVIAKMSVDDDRAASLRAALDAVVADVGALPIARTQVFFDEPEGARPGSGELFSLVLNPDVCKCPELVYAACEGQGVRLIEKTPEALDAARRLFALWERLPDTSGDTIERARTDAKIGPLAAILLSRHCQYAMSGGDGAEAGSGAKLALRHVLALAEFHQQPRSQKLLSQLDELHDQVAARIHESLAKALPTEDLDALAEGLNVLGQGDVRLAELSQTVESAVTQGRVDADQLARLVDVARALADLRWRITKGPGEAGRSRFGMVIAPGAVAPWAGSFPYNPFAGPLVIDAGGETAPLALGLLEGQMRQVLEGLRLLRRARLELEQRGDVQFEVDRLASLRFCDLTDDERACCPPMFLVGDGRALGGRELSDVIRLLDANLPIKIVALTGAGGTIDGGLGVDALDSHPSIERIDLAVLAMLTRKAFVVQSSIAAPEHFADGVLRAMAFGGPAFIHLHAPSPERHGFDIGRLHDQADLALRSRAFPLFTFDPTITGAFGSCLDIAANPSAASRWMSDEDDAAITPIDWTMTEERFADHLSETAPADRTPNPAAAWLALPATEQRKHVLMTKSGAFADDAMAADTVERMRLWRTLQELAGIVTPFTQAVREQAKDELAHAYEAEVEQIRREYESRIAQLRGEYQSEATSRVTSGLLALAGYTDGVGDQEQPT